MFEIYARAGQECPAYWGFDSRDIPVSILPISILNPEEPEEQHFFFPHTASYRTQ